MKNKTLQTKLVNRFSWHKHSGDFAEKHLISKYFKDIGFSFRKIRKDKNGKKPDGYILNSARKKVALAEIKLITSKKRVQGVHITTLDETIRKAIKKAKTQLRTINSNLPKIIYIIRDDVFLKSGTLRWALFGKWKTVISRGGKTIFNDYSGFFPQNKEDNKFRDNLISAVICYMPTLTGYSIWIYRNKNAPKIPKKLLNKKHLEEFWDYDSSELKQVF